MTFTISSHFLLSRIKQRHTGSNIGIDIPHFILFTGSSFICMICTPQNSLLQKGGKAYSEPQKGMPSLRTCRGALLRTMGAQHPRRLLPQVRVYPKLSWVQGQLRDTLNLHRLFKPVSGGVWCDRKSCVVFTSPGMLLRFLTQLSLLRFFFIYSLVCVGGADHFCLFLFIFLFYGQRWLFLNTALCFRACIIRCISIKAQGASNSKLMGQN